MAKAEVTNRKIVIKLELQEEEAKYLRGILQNDLGMECRGIKESEEYRAIREEIFEELSRVLRGQ